MSVLIWRTRRTGAHYMLTVGAAQLGPIARNESRAQVVDRLIDHLSRQKVWAVS